jgi:multicomponent Na+:H+ antiporter subunit D
MPWTMGAFAVGALSLIGLPPTAGFFSKWYIVNGAAAAENWVALGVLGASTLLNAAYFLPILHSAFFREERVAPIHHHGEAPAASVAALVITAVLTLALPFLGSVPLELARAVAGS